MGLSIVLSMVGLLASGAASATPPAVAAPARTYSGVTQAILTCVRDRSHKQHGTVYIPNANNPNNGTSETHYYGLTQLAYAFDPTRAKVTYTILQKPALASNGQVWDGIGAAIQACS